MELVDDGDACTETVCIPASGELSHEPIPNCGSGGSGGGGAMIVEPGWQPLNDERAPKPRYLHSAVWTGEKMIVWGGRIDGTPNVSSAGGAYDPVTDSWTTIESDGAPSPRHSHTAVWTGTHMLIWGGFGLTELETDGGRYDPATNSWSAMTDTDAPTGRTGHSAVWTGESMMVWGGIAGISAIQNGGIYNPDSDTWTPIDTTATLSKRFNHAAAWDGSRMLVWGGADTFDWLGTGGFYDPEQELWSGITETDAPSFRESSSSIWTGSELLIWGGWNGGTYFNDGALLDPAAEPGSWRAMSDDGPPSVRARHASVWAGSELVIWGGCTGAELCGEVLNDGGRWLESNSGGSWSPVPADEDVPGRYGHTLVWTGEQIILFGGRAATSLTYAGGWRAVPARFAEL